MKEKGKCNSRYGAKLSSGESVYILVDGPISALIVYPDSQKIQGILCCIEDALQKKGFFTSLLNTSRITDDSLERFSTEAALFVVLIDNDDPVTFFTLAYLKAKGKEVIAVSLSEENKEISKLPFSSEGVALVQANSLQLFESKLDEVLSKKIGSAIEHYSELILSDRNFSNKQERDKVKEFIRRILILYFRPEEVSLEALDTLVKGDQCLKGEQYFDSLFSMYTLLILLYLRVLDRENLSFFERKRRINRIKSLIKFFLNRFDISNCPNESCLILDLKRILDCYLLMTIYDQEGSNFETAIDYLKKVLEFTSEREDLFRASVLNSLGVAYFLKWDTNGLLEDIDSAIGHVSDSLHSIEPKKSLWIYEVFRKNLGLFWYRKGSILKEVECFRKAFEYLKGYDSNSSFSVDEDTVSKIYITNCKREFFYHEDRCEKIKECIYDYKDVIFSFHSEEAEEIYGIVLREKARAYQLIYEIEKKDDYLQDASLFYNKALEFFSLSEVYSVQRAITAICLARFYLSVVDTEKTESSKYCEEYVQILEDALSVLTIDEQPRIFAEAHMILGDLYFKMGENECRDEFYLRAIDSYEQALRVYKDSVYSERGLILKNIAYSYYALGRILDDCDYFGKVVEYCELLLEESKNIKHNHYQLATIYGLIGEVLLYVFQDEGIGNKRDVIEKALSYLNSSVDEAEKEGDRFLAFSSKLNLGICYRTLGELEFNKDLLEKSLSIFQNLLEEWKKELDSGRGAALYHNIGDTLWELYKISGSKDYLSSSLESYNECVAFLEPSDSEKKAFVWLKIGICFKELALLEPEEENLRKAVDSFVHSLEYYNRETFPDEFFSISRDIGDICSQLSSWVLDGDIIKIGIKHYQNSLEFFPEELDSFRHALIANNIGNMYRVLSELEGKHENATLAIKYLTDALRSVDEKMYPTEFITVKNNLAVAYTTLAEMEISPFESVEKAKALLLSAIEKANEKEQKELVVTLSNNLCNVYVLAKWKGLLLKECFPRDLEQLMEASVQDEKMEETVLFAFVSSTLAHAYKESIFSCDSEEKFFVSLDKLAKSYEIFRDKEFKRGAAFALNNMGNLYLELWLSSQDSSYLKKVEEKYSIALSLVSEQSSYLKSLVDNNLGVSSLYFYKIMGGQDFLDEALSRLEEATRCLGESEETVFSLLCKYNHALAKKEKTKEGSEDITCLVGIYNDALSFYNKDRFPLEYGKICYHLGRLFLEYGLEHSELESLDRAIKNLTEATGIFNENQYPLYCAVANYALGEANLALYAVSNFNTRNIEALPLLKKAKECLLVSLEIFEQEGNSHMRALTELQLGKINDLLFDHREDISYMMQAVDYYRSSFSFFKDSSYSDLNEEILSYMSGSCKKLLESFDRLEKSSITLDQLRQLLDVFTSKDFTKEYVSLNIMLARLCIDLADSDPKVEMDEAIQFLEDAYCSFNSEVSEKEALDLKKKIARHFYMLGKDGKDPNLIRKAISIYEEIISLQQSGELDGDLFLTVLSEVTECYLFLGDVFFERKDYESLLEEMDGAIRTYSALGLKDKESEFEFLKVKGAILQALSGEKSFEEVQEMVESATPSLTSYLDEDKAIELFGLVGAFYRSYYDVVEQKELLEKAISCYREIKEIASSESDVVQRDIKEVDTKLGELYAKIGTLYVKEKNYEKAIENLETARRYMTGDFGSLLFKQVSVYISDCYAELASLNLGEDRAKAMDMLECALIAAQEAKDEPRCAAIRRKMASLYRLEALDRDDLDLLKRSASTISKSLDFYTKEKFPKENAELTLFLANIYEELSRFENSRFNTEQAIALIEYLQKNHPSITSKDDRSLFEHKGDLYIRLYEEEKDIRTIYSAIEAYRAFLSSDIEDADRERVEHKFIESSLKLYETSRDEDRYTLLRVMEDAYQSCSRVSEDLRRKVCVCLISLYAELSRENGDYEMLKKGLQYLKEYNESVVYDAEGEDLIIEVRLDIVTAWLDLSLDKKAVFDEPIFAILDVLFSFYDDGKEVEGKSESLVLIREKLFKLGELEEDVEKKFKLFEKVVWLKKEDLLSARAFKSMGDLRLSNFGETGSEEMLGESFHFYTVSKDIFSAIGNAEGITSVDLKLEELSAVMVSRIVALDGVEDQKHMLKKWYSLCSQEIEGTGVFELFSNLAKKLDILSEEKTSRTNYAELIIEIYDLFLKDDIFDEDSLYAGVLLEVVSSSYKRLSGDKDIFMLSKSLSYGVKAYNIFTKLKENSKKEASQLQAEIRDTLNLLLQRRATIEDPEKVYVAFLGDLNLCKHVFDSELLSRIKSEAVLMLSEMDRVCSHPRFPKMVEEVVDELNSSNEHADYLYLLEDKLFDIYLQHGKDSLFSSAPEAAIEYYSKAKERLKEGSEKGFDVFFGLGRSYALLWDNYKKRSDAEKAIECFLHSTNYCCRDEEKLSMVRDNVYSLVLSYVEFDLSTGELEAVIGAFEELWDKIRGVGKSQKDCEYIKKIVDMLVKDVVTEPLPNCVERLRNLCEKLINFYSESEYESFSKEIKKGICLLEEEASVFSAKEVSADIHENVRLVGTEDTLKEEDSSTLLKSATEKVHVAGEPKEESFSDHTEKCLELGESCIRIAEERGDLESALEAIEAFKKALDSYSSSDGDTRAYIFKKIGDAHLIGAKLALNEVYCREAISAYQESLEYYNLENFSERYYEIVKLIADAEYIWGEFAPSKDLYLRCVGHYMEVLRVIISGKVDSKSYKEICKNIEDVLKELEKAGCTKEDFERMFPIFETLSQIDSKLEDYSSYASVWKTVGDMFFSYAFSCDKQSEKEKLLCQSEKCYIESATYFDRCGNREEYSRVCKILGDLYFSFAIFKDSSEVVKSSIKYYEEALSLYSLDSFPVEYGSINDKLGSLYMKLSNWEDNIENYRKTVFHFKEVLKVYKKEQHPLEYAAVLNNLGMSYSALAEKEDRSKNCHEAIECYCRALKVYNINDYPIQYSLTHNNLGSVYRILAEEENKVENCKKAVASYKEALKIRTIHRMPIQFAATQNNLGVAYRTLAEEENKERNCSLAIRAYEAALVVYTLDRYPIQYATTQINIAGAYATLAEVKDPERNRYLSIKSYREAQRVYTKEMFSDIYDMIEENISSLQGIGTVGKNADVG